MTEFDTTVTVTVRVTSLGSPATGPRYGCAGEPAEPPTWELVGVDEDEINEAVAQFVAELRDNEAHDQREDGR